MRRRYRDDVDAIEMTWGGGESDFGRRGRDAREASLRFLHERVATGHDRVRKRRRRLDRRIDSGGPGRE